MVAKSPPRARLPVSPMNILAGFLLKYKNPRQALDAAIDMMARSILPLIKHITAQAKNAKNEQPDASPSSPSVKFRAFDEPTIINTAKNG